MYTELERLVPAVLPAARLRTKSQIIARASEALHALAAANARAEARAAVHAPAARAAWVHEVVRAEGLQGAAAERLARLVVDYRWAYAEVWTECGAAGRGRDGEVSANGNGAGPGSPVLAKTYRLRNYVTGLDGEHGQAVGAASAEIVFRAGDSSQLGRAAATAEPAWRTFVRGVAGEGDCDTIGVRYDAAKLAGFVVSCALPIVVNGQVESVIVLFNDTFSADDRPHLAVAVDLAGALGDCLSNLHTVVKEE